MDSINVSWRGSFTNTEVNALHAGAFETSVVSDDEWDWRSLTAEHSLGWVTARRGDELIGFVNVISDGFVHAWLQDVMVSPSMQRSGVGVKLVDAAREASAEAGCEWLHVDFDDHLRAFHFDACGFAPTNAGLIDLT